LELIFRDENNFIRMPLLMRACLKIISPLLLMAACILHAENASAAPADTSDEAQLDVFLPRYDSLDDILKKIQANPDNLDNYYAYAKAAETIKNYKEAIWAYKEMLAHDKSLDRV